MLQTDTVMRKHARDRAMRSDGTLRLNAATLLPRQMHGRPSADGRLPCTYDSTGSQVKARTMYKPE